MTGLKGPEENFLEMRLSDGSEVALSRTQLDAVRRGTFQRDLHFPPFAVTSGIRWDVAEQILPLDFGGDACVHRFQLFQRPGEQRAAPGQTCDLHQLRLQHQARRPSVREEADWVD